MLGQVRKSFGTFPVIAYTEITTGIDHVIRSNDRHMHNDMKFKHIWDMLGVPLHATFGALDVDLSSLVRLWFCNKLFTKLRVTSFYVYKKPYY